MEPATPSTHNLNPTNDVNPMVYEITKGPSVFSERLLDSHVPSRFEFGLGSGFGFLPCVGIGLGMGKMFELLEETRTLQRLEIGGYTSGI
jgi:hypothetical protein